MNTTISTTLDVLRVAAHALPGTTVQVASATLSLPDGAEVYTINELDRRGDLVAKGRLHVVVDMHGVYPVRSGSALHDQIIGSKPRTLALISN